MIEEKDLQIEEIFEIEENFESELKKIDDSNIIPVVEHALNDYQDFSEIEQLIKELDTIVHFNRIGDFIKAGYTQEKIRNLITQLNQELLRSKNPSTIKSIREFTKLIKELKSQIDELEEDFI